METIHSCIWIGSPQSIFNHDLIYLARFFYKKHYQIKRVHWLSFCRLYDTVWQQHPSPHNALVFLLHGWLFEGKLLCAWVEYIYDTVSLFLSLQSSLSSTSTTLCLEKMHSLFSFWPAQFASLYSHYALQTVDSWTLLSLKMWKISRY